MSWHLRLGHSSFPCLNKLFHTLFKGLNCSSFYGSFFFLSKSHCATYLPTPYQTSKPFYLIHSDVWDPYKVITISEKIWFVTFIYDHTRLCLVYLMNDKSKVEKLSKDFNMMIENQFQWHRILGRNFRDFSKRKRNLSPIHMCWYYSTKWNCWEKE